MKAPKVIHFLTFGDIPYDQRLLRIWHTLHNQGFEVHIYCRKLHKVDYSKYPFQVKSYQPLFKTSFLAYIEYACRSLASHIFTSVQVISCADLDTIISGQLIRLLKGAKFYYDAHEYFTEVPEVVDRPTVQKIWRLIERIAMMGKGKRYTVSEGYALLFQKKYDMPFEIIRNVPYKTFKPNHLSQCRNKIVYQGALNMGRGLAEMIQAMPFIQDVEFHIIGDGDITAELIDLVESMSLDDRVIFHGKLLPEEITHLTKDARLGVNLLENKGLSYHYSLANKFFDYIQSGLVQLCIDFPEYRKLNELIPIAHLIPDINPLTIADAINLLMKDENYFLSLQHNLSHAANEWCWEIEEKKLLRLYMDDITTS